MNREDVIALSRNYLTALNEEKELRAELLDLKMYGQDDDALQAAVLQHDTLVGKIDAVRHQRMLPILRELVEFVGAEQGGPRDAGERVLSALKRGRRKARRGKLKEGMVAKKRKRKVKRSRPELKLAAAGATS